MVSKSKSAAILGEREFSITRIIDAPRYDRAHGQRLDGEPQPPGGVRGRSVRCELTLPLPCMRAARARVNGPAGA
jgi:hypothetical protein